MFAVPGDAQDFHQFAAFVEQQAITLRHPDRQTPGLHQRQADLQQADAEQFALDLACGLAFMDDLQFPFPEQPWVSQGQRPERRQEQQAAQWMSCHSRARRLAKNHWPVAWRAG